MSRRMHFTSAMGGRAGPGHDDGRSNLKSGSYVLDNPLKETWNPLIMPHLCRADVAERAALCLG